MALDWLTTEMKKIAEEYWRDRDNAQRRLNKINRRYPYRKIVENLRGILEDTPTTVLVVATEFGEWWLANIAAQVILCDTMNAYTEEVIVMARRLCSDGDVVALWRERNCA